MDKFAMITGYLFMVLSCITVLSFMVIFLCDSYLFKKLRISYNHVQLLYVMGLLKEKGRAQTKKELDL